MTDALEPRLTKLDEKVLEALPTARPGLRLLDVAKRTERRPYRHGPPVQAATLAEVRGILRGLEHLGRVTGRGGWWRRMDPMDRERTERNA